MDILSTFLWLFCVTYWILVVICLLQGVRSWREHAEYLRTHPPISDEEFVRLCGPDTDPAIAIKVREIVAEFLSVRKETIYPDSRFIEDLGAD